MLKEDRTSSMESIWWCAVFFLVAYGVFFIYSTGYVSSDYPVRGHWGRHCIWALAGLGACLGVSRIARLGGGVCLKWLTWIGYWGSVVGLVLVSVFGSSIGGARRWLSLGPLLFQPAEFAKVFTILAVSRLVCGNGARRFLLIALVVAIPFLLIAFEPSIGNAFSILPCVCAVIGIRCVWHRFWCVVLFCVLVCLIGGGAGVVWIRSHNGVAPVNMEAGGFFRGYHAKRIATYFDPKGNWNERQALMTLASGGAFGKGYLEGTMGRLGYLPRTVAPSDFILAIVGEEMGFFFGVLPILLLFSVVIGIGLHWAGRSRNDILACSSGGVLVLMCVHILVNVGMNVRLVPVIGLPLPLLSYGGSFTLAMFVALGMVHSAGRTADNGTEGDKVPQEDTIHFGRFLGIHIRRGQ